MLVLVTLAAAGPAVGAEMNAVAINGRHLMAVKKELEAAGVKPAMDPAKVRGDGSIGGRRARP
jgi:hypothetical protein